MGRKGQSPLIQTLMFPVIIVANDRLFQSLFVVGVERALLFVPYPSWRGLPGRCPSAVSLRAPPCARETVTCSASKPGLAMFVARIRSSASCSV